MLDSLYDEGYVVVVTVVLFEYPLFEYPLGRMTVGSIETFPVCVVIMVVWNQIRVKTKLILSLAFFPQYLSTRITILVNKCDRIALVAATVWIIATTVHFDRVQIEKYSLIKRTSLLCIQSNYMTPWVSVTALYRVIPLQYPTIIIILYPFENRLFSYFYTLHENKWFQ